VTETQILIDNIGAFSYLGVFVISILANIVVPFPEEIVILVMGYVVGTGVINGFIAFPIILLGLIISDTVMYLLARRGARLLTAFYDRFFAKTLSSRQDWIDRNPGRVIFYTRFMMQFRFLGPFLAGQKKMPYMKFLKYELAALLIYVPVLLLVGDYFQDRFQLIVNGLGTVRNIFLILIGIAILFALSKFIRDIAFGEYVLARTGSKKERTWIPGVYKKKKEAI
jgi:membrane protein DedA with SNARE-associated domain